MTVSCGVVPVRIEDGTPKYLLMRSRWFWDFPKGRKEEGESDLETAVRETLEESAIPKEELDFRWGTEYWETEPYLKKKNKVGRYFVAYTEFDGVDTPVNPELGHPEHDDFGWFTYEEASEKLNDRMQKVLDWAHKKVSV